MGTLFGIEYLFSYQLTSALLGIGLASIILFLVRRDELHGSFAVWWIITAFFILLFGLFPSLVDLIAIRLGIQYPPTLLLIVSIGLILVKMLTMDIAKSKQEQRLRRLTQRLAMLECDFYRSQPRQKSDD